MGLGPGGGGDPGETANSTPFGGFFRFSLSNLYYYVYISYGTGIKIKNLKTALLDSLRVLLNSF